MSTLPYGSHALEEFVKQEEQGFVRKFRRDLIAARYFTHTPVKSLATTKLEWREISDSAGAHISMEIPALKAQDGLTVTRREAEIPLFTKDLTWGGRALDAIKAGQMDIEESRQAALAMAEEINDFLFYGEGDASGPATAPVATAEGILNSTGALSVDNSATTNWTNPTDVSDDLSDAIKELLVKGHTPERGQYVLFMNPADSDLLMRWRAETDRQTKDILPQVIGAPVFEGTVPQNKAQLVAVSPDNFDVVGPMGMGDVRTFRDDPGEVGNMMGKPLWVRHLWAGTVRIKRPDFRVDITFDRA